MKTVTRHITTFLGGFGSQLLALGWINADAVPGINESATALTNPLIVVIGLIGALLTRVLIAVVSNLFRTGTGESKSDSAGGLSPCVLGLCMAAGLMGLATPSCTPAQIETARAIPIRIGIESPNASLGYSSKSGLDLRARVQGDK